MALASRSAGNRCVACLAGRHHMSAPIVANAANVEPEWSGEADRPSEDTAQRRPDRAADVDPDAVGVHRRGEVLSRDERRHNRLPGRRRHRARRADHEHKYQQRDRRDNIERDQCREHRRRDGSRDFDHDQEASFVHDVRQRAAGSANRNIPKLVATCTSDTINGCVVRFVIAMRPPRCTSRYRRWRRRLRSISPQTCGDGMGSTENERTWLVLERP